jgi:nicotinamidase-related amidase
MLEPQNCCLVIVDVQGKLAQLMHDRQALFKNLVILAKAARILDIPVLWCQQCPEALGPTISELAELLTDNQPINKSSFSCCGDPKFVDKLQHLPGREFLLCGIEAHVCIYQTAVELVQRGWRVSVIADAVSSRTARNKEIALEAMRAEAVKLSSTEMVLFELLGGAEHPKFKQIAKLVK